jgi:hypothetical protein
MFTPKRFYEPVENENADRVREHTDENRLALIDNEARARIAGLRDAPPEALTERIDRLERESDIERVLEINASTLALVGIVLGAFVNRKLLALPAAVLAFLLQHGVQGWCPPVPVLRRLGVRTRQEIDAERYALKAIRGDFQAMSRS